jgi:hypothetical protein
MRKTSYTDSLGRRWAVMLPDDLSDSRASEGLHIGPPSLESLGLPQEIEVRLHNALHDRQLLTPSDVKARRRDVQGALSAAFRLDVSRVIELYLNGAGDHTLSETTSPTDTEGGS